MKKNYFLYLTLCASILLSLTVPTANAQVINKSILYVKDNSKFHLKQGSFSFASPATTETTRTANYGVVSFGATATAVSPSNAHYVDGYTRYYGTQALVVPSGDANIYAPAKITPSAITGVDVAYDRLNPNTEFSATLGTGIEAISAVEYWKIIGTAPTKISLSWRLSSDVENLLSTPSLAFLTIVGYDGTEWVEITSFPDTNSFTGGISNLVSGSLSSVANVDLTAFTAFTIGAKVAGNCYPTVLSSGNLKTWNGTTWSPTRPEYNDPVKLDADYTGSLACYSVDMNGFDITLTNTDVMDVIASFTDGSTAVIADQGKVVMSSNAVLMQREDTATPPKIEITKVTRPMRRFDYVFISSPIASFSTFFADLQDNDKTFFVEQVPPGQTPPAMVTPAFYNFFTSNNTGVQVNVTPSNVPVAQGLGAAVHYDSPTYANNASTPGAWFTEKKVVQITTTGTTNNGIIPLTLPTTAGWFRLGNPYPSPINAKKLLNAMGGTNFRQTLYFWTHTTPRAQWVVNGMNYQAADYATYNLMGGTAATNGDDPLVPGDVPDEDYNELVTPNGLINTMQSVFVRTLVNNPIATPLVFNLDNCLRDTAGNDNFFRTAEDNRIGKFRINLVGSESSFSQILVGYHPEATLAYDNGYDAPRIGGATASELNSLIGTSNTGYAIQGRNNFSNTDVIPLQLANRTQETFTISLQNKEGFFTTDPITIYLQDTFTNVYHDLSQGGYSFTAVSGIDNNRFKIVYQSNALGVGDDVIDNAYAYINNEVLSVKANRMIEKIQLFDLTGRVIQTYENVDNTVMTDVFNHAKAVYLAKITLDNNVVVTQKIINN